VLAADTVPSAAALRSAARELVSSLRREPSADYQVAVLKRVARQLDDEDQFPLFIKLLIVVGESRDPLAQRVLARAFGSALERMDHPSGRLTSWGGSSLWHGETSTSARALSARFDRAPLRRFGAIEFLTVWLGQSTQRPLLHPEIYRRALIALIALFDSEPTTRERYIAELESSATQSLEGRYSGLTRQRLARLAEAWQAGKSPAEIADAVIAIGSERGTHTWQRGL
jgi:hypothetical protein